MNASECECILGDDKNLQKIVNCMEKLNNKNTIFINFDKENKGLNFEKQLQEGKVLVENGNTKFEKIQIDPDELRILLFTSGTTGNAKGVCLSQRNICSNILSTYGIVKVKRSDLFFSVLPLHHTYECTIGFLLPLYSGASICYCDGLRYITTNMQEYHPSVILCVPLLLEKMYQKIMKSMCKSLPKKYTENTDKLIDGLPFYLKTIVKRKVKNTLGGRLRVFIVGAAAVNPEIADTFDKLGLNSLQGYGLTECAPLVAGNTDFYKRNDSAGLPIPNVEYKIENPNEEGIGEIVVKGPNVMLGYYNMPEETEKVLKDGWFHTGDLGKIDENGFLYITGRCKSVIVTKNGKNIYPEEIESYLNDNPLISEALVIGVKKDNDDETYVNAQIFPNIDAITEYLKGTVPTKEEIKKIISDVVTSVNRKIPNYKHIKNFVIRDKEFEKTTTQKIKRYGENMKSEK
jgi:long-chain acyl-CoA synthetase